MAKNHFMRGVRDLWKKFLAQDGGLRATSGALENAQVRAKLKCGRAIGSESRKATHPFTDRTALTRGTNNSAKKKPAKAKPRF